MVLSPRKRTKLIALLSAHVPYREISRLMLISRNTVRRYAVLGPGGAWGELTPAEARSASPASGRAPP